MADRIYPKLSTRNIEEEVLKEIQSRRSQRDMNMLKHLKSRKSVNGTSACELPVDVPSTTVDMFYRDFGAFEVITCTADDGKQVVMVVLEGKVCINGEPVRVLSDGIIILGNGQKDSKLQNYFECAMEARRQQRTETPSGKLQLVGRDPGEELYNIVSDINEIVASMTRQNWFRCKSQKGCLFKKRTDSNHLSTMTDLVSKLNILNEHTRVVIENLNDMTNQLLENERGLLALVKAVKCFSNEAILSEPDKYTNAVYKDIYDKYLVLVKKEEEATSKIQEMRSKNEALKLDKNVLQRKLNDLESERDNLNEKIRQLDEINSKLNLTNSKSLTENLNLEKQSSMLEVEVKELREKSKRERRQTKHAVQQMRHLEKQMEKLKLENEQLRREHHQTRINNELYSVASRLGIDDRIKSMTTRQAFLTLKDHKESFNTNPSSRLINPAKSEMSKVSKVILDSINTSIRSQINVNQWTNTLSVIEWFKRIPDKKHRTFIMFDIVDFYPSISLDLLTKAINWAKTMTHIPRCDIDAIMNARHSLLFDKGKAWVKRGSNSRFDVAMGSYDGAEVCELIGLFALNGLKTLFSDQEIGLYRDDGLAAFRKVPTTTGLTFISILPVLQPMLFTFSDNLKKVSSRKRLQDRSILKLKEEKRKVEDDLERLRKIVRGALQDRSKMASQLNTVTQSNFELQK
ncbi:hypothetical protein HOLleu_24177 [Holothuria leucospilota]|uniref:Uncharacterized protein n=1 Tax=Holothuria leucospilota TaxID=206669 RepID=A0A9Q1BWA9_HOLLE|nr:hypothetical protein HOLleu_24177 [Holothuria leucospilota]